MKYLTYIIEFFRKNWESRIFKQSTFLAVIIIYLALFHNKELGLLIHALIHTLIADKSSLLIIIGWVASILFSTKKF